MGPVTRGQPDPARSLVQAALDLARRGARLLPCQPRGKVPLCSHGCRDATSDTGAIRTRFQAAEPVQSRPPSAVESSTSDAQVGHGDPTSSALDGRNCHHVTTELENALANLDQGRVDLARAALERALARLRKGGAR